MKRWIFLLQIAYRLTQGLLFIVLLLFIGVIYYIYNPHASFFLGEPVMSTPVVEAEADKDLVKDGIHVATGLKEGEGLMLVVQNCTACHSAKLITQNKATEDGWRSMIKWMQQTQNLWDLGTNEDKIVAYLAKNYAPDKSGRRKPLTNIEWYELK